VNFWQPASHPTVPLCLKARDPPLRHCVMCEREIKHGLTAGCTCRRVLRAPERKKSALKKLRRKRSRTIIQHPALSDIGRPQAVCAATRAPASRVANVFCARKGPKPVAPETRASRWQGAHFTPRLMHTGVNAIEELKQNAVQMSPKDLETGCDRSLEAYKAPACYRTQRESLTGFVSC